MQERVIATPLQDAPPTGKKIYDIDSLLDFCHTLVDTSILYSIIKVKE